LFTGQQKEPDGDPLGLYDYKARFYSTLTGRFVSADPLATDGLNRYTYVRDNPLGGTDPSGLYLQIACGWTEDCNQGNHHGTDPGSIENWRLLVIQYWLSGKSKVDFGHDLSHLNFVFDLFAGSLGTFDEAQIIRTFDVFAWDSSPGGRRYDVVGAAGDLADVARKAPEPITYLAGFSFGALTSYEYLWEVSHGYAFGVKPLGVYLIGAPNVYLGGFYASPYGTPGALGQSYSISAAFGGGVNVVARSARVRKELTIPILALPGVPISITVDIGRIEPELDGGARMRSAPSCGHCMSASNTFFDAFTLFWQ